MAITKSYTKKLHPNNKHSRYVIIPKIFLIVLGIDPEKDKVEISINEDSNAVIIKKVEDEKDDS